MRFPLYPALAALGLALPLVPAAQAQTFEAVNRLQVVPISNTDFEVIEAYGEGARGMWCAAADYAMHGLQRRSGRMYIKSPRGASVTGGGRSGAIFTLDEASLPGEPTRSYSVNTTTPGLSLPIQHAYQFCADYLIDIEDILFRHGRY